MRFVIITGLSGAGKSTAIRLLEDFGFFCIDNLPPPLIPKFAEICSHSEGKIEKVAIVIDSRVGYLFKDIFTHLSRLNDMGYTYEILFLEASDEVIVKRFKENRRIHPIARSQRVIMGIKEEKKILKDVKARANYIIDTSNLAPKQLKEHLINFFMQGKDDESLIISIISFGFKHSTPIDVDLIFDVRFIPNPFYIESMKRLSGRNEKVRNFVLQQQETQVFLQKINDLLDFLIPNYVKEGKSQLVIGIGCTGGQHRSVVITDELGNSLTKKGYKTIIDHRDVQKDGRCI